MSGVVLHACIYGSTILSTKLTANANRQFHFDECHQLFIRAHNVTLAIATMRVGNPDR